MAEMLQLLQACSKWEIMPWQVKQGVMTSMVHPYSRVFLRWQALMIIALGECKDGWPCWTDSGWCACKKLVGMHLCLCGSTLGGSPIS